MTDNNVLILLNDNSMYMSDLSVNMTYDNRSRKKQQNHVQNAAIIIGVAVSAPILAVIAAKVSGFTASGVKKRSFAAYFMRQWSIYAGGTVGKSSPISVLQNLGAKGYDSPYLIPIGIVCGATTALILYAPNIYTFTRRILSSPIFHKTLGKASEFVASQLRAARADLTSCIQMIKDSIYGNDTTE